MSRHQITPAWQTSRGPIVQAHGCAVGVPLAGVKVFGETRQNLWVNPATRTSSGVTLTANDDGSVTLSGTSTANIWIITGNQYSIKPSTTYTLSADGIVSVDTVTVGFYVSEFASDGTETAHVINSGKTSVTFTTKADCVKTTYGFLAYPGVTVSGTYRVMLNEGGTAQPWCPPGLTSVSELGLACAGKNLLPPLSEWQVVMNGYVYAFPLTGFDGRDVAATVAKVPDSLEGNFRLEFTADYKEATGDYGYKTLDPITGYINAPTTAAKTVPAGTKFVQIMTSNPIGNILDEFEIQLELGSSATAYEPPSVTTAPIDLSGHELRSLPNGTRDVLTVDGSGAVSVEQEVNSATFDGSSDENWQLSTADNGHGIANFRISIPDMITGSGVAGRMCDTLPVSAVLQSEVTYPCALAATGMLYVRLYSDEADTVDELRTWLAAHPTTIVYKNGAAQTVPLDPITPPTVPAVDASLWAASDVPCDLEATTWTASGAEHGRQQAAMVKVAQQVRQQAETVAALAAQSLEA